MALHSQILLFISLSFLVFQFIIATPTPAPAPTPIGRISSISFPSSGSPSSLSSSPSPSSALKGDKASINNYVASLMQTSADKTEQFVHNVVEKRLTDPAADPFVKDCLLVCKEVYENGVTAMKKTMEDINNGYYYSANVDLSALSTDLDTCMDCVKEIYGEDQEFIKFNDWAEHATNDALEKIVVFTS